VVDLANDAIILLAASGADYPESRRLSQAAKRLATELDLLSSRKVLIVLDDVMTTNTVRFFDEQIKVGTSAVGKSPLHIALFLVTTELLHPCDEHKCRTLLHGRV